MTTRVEGIFKPLRDGILVRNMDFGERKTASGLIVLSDDGKVGGIHPRWGEVIAVGNEQSDVQVGQYVMVAHGRWTRGINITDAEGDKTIRCVDPKDCLLVSDEPQTNMAYGDKEGA